MQRKTLEQLDYFRIQNAIAFYCKTEEGREALLERLPLSDEKEIRTLKELGFEMKGYVAKGFSSLIRPFEAVAALFPKISVEGAALNLEEVHRLGEFLLSVQMLHENKNALLEKTENLDTFKNLFPLLDSIPLLSSETEEVYRIIDRSGQMKDLPQLRAIRKSIASLQSSIDKSLKAHLHNPLLKDALQAELPALRGDRQVLAVKANFRGRVRGIVHELSQTGQTLYIEPEDIVEKNNALVQEEHRLQVEIKKILQALCSLLRPSIPLFQAAHNNLLFLDALNATALWATEHNCHFAFEKKLSLLQARHPLLGSDCVPIDIVFQKDCRVLIITGPNTGGKTVSLKTIALFSLLNQAGFPIPAQEGSSLPYFSSVFADIGDEQSMDESLSTFSAHMKNISAMLSASDEKSLVLLDELGSGTDPQEGGAIAMAVLDALIEKKAYVLVTTHHGVLKNYGFTHPSCVNASVAFDSTSLSPTYKILMGVPGESHAINIARKSGLPESIVEQAERYMAGGDADVSALIKALTEKLDGLSEKEKELEKKERLTHEAVKKADLKALRIRQQELQLKDAQIKESNRFLSDSRKMLENLVREIREAELTKATTKKVKDSIAALEAGLEDEKRRQDEKKEILAKDLDAQEKAADKTKSSKTKLEAKDFQKDDRVIINSTKMKGVIVSKDKKNSYLVLVGSVKMSVSKSNLSLDTREVQLGSPSIQFDAAPSSGDKPVFELRLLGMRGEEALQALEKQLELCILHAVSSFSIIHGKGDGILQNLVHEFLKNYPGIRSFDFAPPEDGGTGKTYVTL